MGRYQLVYYTFLVTSLHCLLSVTSSAFDNSGKCGILPPDCSRLQFITPFDGGPPCTCTATQRPQGCILKPCELVNDDTLCDCSRSTGSLKNRLFCRKYRCTGKPGQRQTCRDLPPNCTMKSLYNPPAKGGPDCSCANHLAPPGCTLKPCVQARRITDACVSKPGGVSALYLFGTLCPDNWKSTERKFTGTDKEDKVTAWMLGASSAVLLTFGIVFLGISTVFVVRDHVVEEMTMIAFIISLIMLVTGVVLLGIGLWFVLN